MIWKKEVQLVREVEYYLQSRGYLFYRIEAGVGAAVGLPDAVCISKFGKITFMEFKCITKPATEDDPKVYELRKRNYDGIDSRFKFNGVQQARFRELLASNIDVLVLIAEKGTKNIAYTTFSYIDHHHKIGLIPVKQTERMDKLLADIERYGK